MIQVRTLRGRLVAAMVVILVLAMGVSSVVDRLQTRHMVAAEDEPYQDGLVLIGFFLPALALIWAVSSWSLRPLARISQEALNIGPARPSTRLSPAGLPAEIVPMVLAVNGALDRMAAAFEAERRFTENAAHELRTPLAVLSLRLQRARQSSAGDSGPDWAAIDGDVAQLNRLVSQMLDLARKENAGRANTASARPIVDFSRIVREACAAILPMIETQGRRLTVAIPDGMNLHGDDSDLHDALRNLLENAVLHGQGAIAVDAKLDDGHGRFEVWVSDEGPGFDDTNVTTLFERFSKGSRSEGSGLGLAIVREVLRSHGGDAIAMPGPPGLVKLYLPASS